MVLLLLRPGAELGPTLLGPGLGPTLPGVFVTALGAMRSRGLAEIVLPDGQHIVGRVKWTTIRRQNNPRKHADSLR